jgi:rubrerythrin
MNQNRVFGEPVLGMSTPDRRSFLKVAGLVGIGTGLVAGGLGTGTAFAAGSSGISDVEILQYALALEYLESEFYTTGYTKVPGLSVRTKEIVGAVLDHEQAHVKIIQKALGGKAKSRASYGIKIPSKVYSSEQAFLKTAATFEDVGVQAYLGQVTLISSGTILEAAASIEGVEARHSAIFYSLTNQQPFPAPIDPHRTQAQTINIVKGFYTNPPKPA